MEKVILMARERKQKFKYKKKHINTLHRRKKITKGVKLQKTNKTPKKAPIKQKAKQSTIQKQKNDKALTKKSSVKTEKPVEPQQPKREITFDAKKVTAILADAQIRQNLIELGGENALSIIRNFYGNFSDDDMAKRLKLKISDVRATLNKLHNEGLVNYIREKDNETGWYSYSWSLNLPRIEKWAETQLKRIGTNGNTDYYFCSSCGSASITNFESAVNWDFKCERCSKPLEYIEESKINELYEKRK